MSTCVDDLAVADDDLLDLGAQTLEGGDELLNPGVLRHRAPLSRSACCCHSHGAPSSDGAAALFTTLDCLACDSMITASGLRNCMRSCGRVPPITTAFAATGSVPVARANRRRARGTTAQIAVDLARRRELRARPARSSRRAEPRAQRGVERSRRAACAPSSARVAEQKPGHLVPRPARGCRGCRRRAPRGRRRSPPARSSPSPPSEIEQFSTTSACPRSDAISRVRHRPQVARPRPGGELREQRLALRPVEDRARRRRSRRRLPRHERVERRRAAGAAASPLGCRPAAANSTRCREAAASGRRGRTARGREPHRLRHDHQPRSERRAARRPPARRSSVEDRR